MHLLHTPITFLLTYTQTYVCLAPCHCLQIGKAMKSLSFASAGITLPTLAIIWKCIRTSFLSLSLHLICPSILYAIFIANASRDKDIHWNAFNGYASITNANEICNSIFIHIDLKLSSNVSRCLIARVCVCVRERVSV